MAAEGAQRLRGLYAITPECADTARLVTLVEAALAGGASLVQYRAKSRDPALAREQAGQLRALCRRQGIPFIVNDSIALALAVDADGVHIGREDGDAGAARAAIGGRILGVSCYNRPEAAAAAKRAGADYVGLGSVFPSSTKPGAVRAPLAALGEARRLSGLPVAAIGGITLDNAGEAVAAGADMIAVISALFDAADVRGAAQALAAHYSESTHRRAHVRT